ncbi:hypothetical protein CAPTEDRAFT_208100 [Capitella teleta]|uniref:Reverse transcriptase domain-containing protein n=1 Tax=Capitella teleta TaxID=283909 RepID=R7V7C2_CAPTE|nr:hypothetical protein CAPTEDRAFT_208100 [Capitella teleta]|eukprot:ELU14743.1 hypothetical protein CAPTEDRAFT_208100 [Capitella teleta]
MATVYQTTNMILQTAIVTASVRVRQGSPTSCLLFTLVVNDLKHGRKCPSDGWLKWLHLLMLKDDTVLLATTRERAEQKIQILTEYCQTSGMAINQDNTKFMVINGKPVDKEAITTRDYNESQRLPPRTAISTLTWAAQDGNLRFAVKAQCTSKIPYVAKFEAFISKHRDAPCLVKERIFEAALSTEILYSCKIKAQCTSKIPYVAKFEAFISKHRDAPCLVKERVFEAALSTAILYSCKSWLSAATVECALNMNIQCIRCSEEDNSRDQPVIEQTQFEAFISKHRDAPCLVKERVFEAALSTAILYSCKSWLSAATVECALNMNIQCIRCSEEDNSRVDQKYVIYIADFNAFQCHCASPRKYYKTGRSVKITQT